MHAHHYENTGLPLWMRIALYAADHDGQALERGQLRAAVDPLTRPAEIARAVRHGVRCGLLAPGSTSRCLHSTLAVGADLTRPIPGHEWQSA